MTPKNKAAWVGAVTFVFTALVTVFRAFEPGYAKMIWFSWFFFSWNYFAYAFDKRMLPWQFVELKGGGNGNPTGRTFVFWLAVGIHLSFLATMAFADQ